jgi:site-specific recombinase XerD
MGITGFRSEPSQTALDVVFENPSDGARLERLVPIDCIISLPHALTGEKGSNRATGTGRQIEANDDLAALWAFLAEYDESPSTYRTYKKEIERLHLWAWKERGKPLSSLTATDFKAYRDFLSQPPADWIGPRAKRTAPAWRPFTGPLSSTSRRTALTIIHSYLVWLVDANYLAGNPLALVRRRHKTTTLGGHSGQSGQEEPERSRRSATRRASFDKAQMKAIFQAIEALPADSPERLAYQERARYLVTLLYYLGLRVNEVAKHFMHDFKQYGTEWWFELVGKGGGQAQAVPVHPVLLDRLMQYRTFIGLPPLPLDSEDMPLVPKLRKVLKKSRVPVDRHKMAVSDRMINTVLKEVFNRAADALKGSAPEYTSTFDAKGDELEAKPIRDLRRGSAHWLRHTSATHQLDAGIELRQVQQNLRHKKLETTMIYSHVADSERHKAIEKL